MPLSPRTPVLIGVGQIVNHWRGGDASGAPDPIGLNVTASRAALADSGVASALAAAIDTVVVIRTMPDSVPREVHPFGRCANPPGTVAAALGVKPRRAIYSAVGGDSAQTLVNEFAGALWAGETDAVLITGAEATAALKAAIRHGVQLDWSASVDGDCEDRGLGKPLLSKYEMVNGLGAPTQTYPIFENALRARLGVSPEAHDDTMATLWAGFSEVAARNPYAQFPVARSAEFLKAETPENYKVAIPYLKWHVAQDAVNQGAALILATLAKADELGVDPAKRIYLHGYGEARDRFSLERADLSKSRAMETALSRALDSAGTTARGVDLFDIYSCFPCAVLIAAEALGVDWQEKRLTVTGGLPFAGGPGNSYSMHAIATMAELLRKAPARRGLVLANGGFLSKEAAGVYSATPPADWSPVSSADLQHAIDHAPAPRLLNESVEGIVESYTVAYRKDVPNRGAVVARVGDARILARPRNGDRTPLDRLAATDPIGKPIAITHEDGVNYIS